MISVHLSISDPFSKGWDDLLFDLKFPIDMKRDVAKLGSDPTILSHGLRRVGRAIESFKRDPEASSRRFYSDPEGW